MFRKLQEPCLHNFVFRLKEIEKWKKRLANGDEMFLNKNQIKEREQTTINFIIDYLKRDGVYETLKACHI